MKVVVSGRAKTYLGPVDAEDRAIVIVGVSGLGLALRRDLVKANLLVPTRHSEEVLLGAYVLIKGNIGNTVGGRLLDRDILLKVAHGVGSRRRSGTEQTRHVGCSSFSQSSILSVVIFENGRGSSSGGR